MASHSSVLAWRIPGTGEPGRLLSLGSHRVGHDWSDLAAVGDPNVQPGLVRSSFCAASLNLGTIGIWGLVILCSGTALCIVVCLASCLYPLHAVTTPFPGWWDRMGDLGTGTLWPRIWPRTNTFLSNKIQRNYKELKITESTAQLGQIMNNKNTKRPKTQLPLLGSQGQKQGTGNAPCTENHQRGGQTT